MFSEIDKPLVIPCTNEVFQPQLDPLIKQLIGDLIYMRVFSKFKVSFKFSTNTNLHKNHL